MLLRGHTPHDQQLSALLSDPSVTTALLWPGEDALEPHQLQELAAARTNGRIALVAIDATWNGAVKMRRRYPKGREGQGRMLDGRLVRTVVGVVEGC